MGLGLVLRGRAKTWKAQDSVLNLNSGKRKKEKERRGKMHLTKHQDYHQVRVQKKLQNKKEVRVELLETAGNAHSSISLLGLPRQKLWGSLSHPPGILRQLHLVLRIEKMKHLKEESCGGSMRPEQSLGSRRHSNRRS